MIYHKKKNTVYSDLSTVEKKNLLCYDNTVLEKEPWVGSLEVSIPGPRSTRTCRKGVWQQWGQHSALNYLVFAKYVHSTASKARGNGEGPLGMWGRVVGGQFLPPWAIDLTQSQSKSQQVILILKFIWRGKWLEPPTQYWGKRTKLED